MLSPGNVKRCNIGVNKWLADKKMILECLFTVPGQKLIIPFETSIATAALLKNPCKVKTSLFLPCELQHTTPWSLI